MLVSVLDRLSIIVPIAAELTLRFICNGPALRALAMVLVVLITL